MMFHKRIESDADMKELAILSGYPLLRSHPALLAAMIGEVSEGATDEQARGFFNAVGTRLAAMLPLAEVDDADELVAQMNGLWDALGLGRVGLELDDEGIDIIHSDLPVVLDAGDDGLWMKAAPHILEGAYESWFRSLGSGATLTTRLTRAAPGLVELRHGY